jgi:hypothetical protein
LDEERNLRGKHNIKKMLDETFEQLEIKQKNPQ